MLSTGETRALLRLRCARQLGNHRLRLLLEEHGSAESVLASKACPQPSAEEDALAWGRVERALAVIDALEVKLLALHHAGYPEPLRELRTPPVLLFCRGDTRLLGQKSVAVVGTRRPTEYGTEVTEQLVAGLVREGVVIWSGLARGIDGTAHRTALECGGDTVAVLGSGIDVPYPPEHEQLMEQVAAEGLLISEFLPGEPPLADHFPRRNRVLACLAQGVLVIEARADGGALITAEEAAGMRPVMAVPGPIGRLTSLGPNRLIQDGAKLVLEVADVVEELGGPLNAAASRPRPSAKRHWRAVDPARKGRGEEQLHLGEERAGAAGKPFVPQPPAGPTREVWLVLGNEPLHADEIAARSRLPAGQVLGLLLQLEVDGLAVQLGGKRFRRVPRRPRN